MATQCRRTQPPLQDLHPGHNRAVREERFEPPNQKAARLCQLDGRFFDALGIARASLVGNSYGAFLALNQASLAPERVDRVVMINPAGVFASFLPNLVRMLFGGLLSALRPAAKRTRPTVASTLGRNVQLGPDEQDWADLVSLVWGKDMRINAIYPRVFATAELRANEVNARMIRFLAPASDLRGV